MALLEVRFVLKNKVVKEYKPTHVACSLFIVDVMERERRCVMLVLTVNWLFLSGKLSALNSFFTRMPASRS